MKGTGDTSMAQNLHGLDGRFIAFLFLTYCEELRVFGNKVQIIQFHGTTELFTYFFKPWTMGDFLALSGFEII